MSRRVPLSGADISEQEIAAVEAVLRSGVLSIGPAVEEFEARLSRRAGTKYAVAVNSGTSALHLLVRAMDIKDGDEVITSPFSFVASANCLLYERARPVFVDIDPATYNLDLQKVEGAITARTRGLLPVDIFGQPADMRRIRALASEQGLRVIEDACEALGSEYEGTPAGSMADGAAFAFYPNKQITTGEGGAIVTNDSDVARLCRSMRNQGRGEDGVWLCHERLGFNYRLSELHAALGVVQMKRLDSIMARRARVAALYNTRLADSEFVSPPYVAPQVSRMSWQVFVVRVRNDIDRDMVMNRLSRAGIGCRPYFTPIHLQPLYVREFGYKPGDFPVAEQVGRQTIALPFFNALSENQVDYVCGELESACRKCVKPGRRSFRVAPPWLRSGAARREVAAAAGS